MFKLTALGTDKDDAMHAAVIRLTVLITTYSPATHSPFVGILYNRPTVSSTADKAALFTRNVPGHVTFDDGATW